MPKRKHFTIAEADLKKLPRGEQRRMSDLGYVVRTKAEAAKTQEPPK